MCILKGWNICLYTMCYLSLWKLSQNMSNTCLHGRLTMRLGDSGEMASHLYLFLPFELGTTWIKVLATESIIKF